MKDDATGLPIWTCDECGKEIIGWVDDPEKKILCEECMMRKKEDVFRKLEELSRIFDLKDNKKKRGIE